MFDAAAKFMAALSEFVVGVIGERIAQAFRSFSFPVSQTSSVPVTLKVKLSLVIEQALLAEAATRSDRCVPFRVVKMILFP
jgi:hypothetical protein